MHTLELLMVDYLLNALWQAPLVLLCAIIAARITRPAGVHWQHRIWVAALLLELALPALSLLHLPLKFWLAALIAGLSSSISPANGAAVTTVINIMRPHAEPLLSNRMLHGLACTWLLLLTFCIARLLRSLANTQHLLRRARLLTGPLPLPLPVHEAQPTPYVRIGISADITGPIALGITRGTILLPLGWRRSLASEDVQAALAHEAAHILRRDFAKNLVYELLACPLLLHPAVWITRQRLAETREMVCDELAARAGNSPRSYAHSLLRLATAAIEPHPTSTSHYGIGIFDAGILERRIMQLTTTNNRPARRILSGIVLAVLLFATATSALGLAFQVDSSTSDSDTGSILHVGGSVKAPVFIEGPQPKYTEAARKAKLSGDALVSLVVDHNGTPQHVQCVKDPGLGLGEKAVEMVQQYKFHPATQNGEPVSVKMMIKVNFSIF